MLMNDSNIKNAYLCIWFWILTISNNLKKTGSFIKSSELVSLKK